MSGLDRRGFMKGAVVAGAIATIGADGKPVSATSLLQGEPAAYFGPEHCANTCGKGADFVYDATGDCFVAGRTGFTSCNLISAMQRVGDHKISIELMAVHSAVHARMQLNNLIDFSSPAHPHNVAMDHNLGFGTFMSKAIIVSDDLALGDNMYETWLFGNGITPERLARESTRNVGPNVLQMVKNWSHVMTGHNEMHPTAKAAHYNAYPNCKECFYVKILTREA